MSDDRARGGWRGFRGRLLLTHLAVVLVVLFGVAAAIDLLVRRHLERQLIDELAREAALVEEMVRDLPPDAERVDPVADRMGAALQSRVTVVERDGRVSGDSEVALAELPSVENHAGRPEVVDARASGDGTSIRWSTTVRKRMIYAARRTAERDRVVRVARATTEADKTARRARVAVLGTGLVGALLAAMLAVTASGALARPIRALTATARAMASGDLARRAASTRSDELGDLGNALDEMAASFARAIEEVTAERNRLAGVLAGMVEGVLVVDAAGRVVLVNPSLREILGIRGDVSGRTVPEAVPSPELHAAVTSVLGGGAPNARVLTLAGKHTDARAGDATPAAPDPTSARTLEARFSVLRSQVDGRMTGLVVVFHDVTELKRLEQVRKDFVASASHELKTPVAAILGASETLAAGAWQDAVAGPRFLDAITRNAARLAALVDDLLDLSRLESRPTEAMREVRPGDALARAAATFGESAAAKRIVLTAPDADDAPPVRADPALLDRALTNLVQNAIRYTPEGGRVALRAVPIDGGVRFEVEDTGIGIPPQALPRIFERFYRVDPARSRELGGTGLGLAIVKHAVEAMDGTVAVRSAPEQGSTFSFTLPLWRG